MNKSIHEITKESWLKATFPEWGTYLNEEINQTNVLQGTVALLVAWLYRHLAENA